MTIAQDIATVLTAHDIVTRNFGRTIRGRRGRPDYVLHVEIDDRNRAVAALVAAGLNVTRIRPSLAAGFIHIWI